MSTLARTMIAWRTPILTAILMLTIVAGLGFNRLAFDDEPQNLFDSDGDDRRTLNTFFERFGADDREVLILVESPDIYNNATIAFLNHLTSSLRTIPSADEVRSYLDVLDVDETGGLKPLRETDRATLRARASNHPLLRELLVSADGTSALVVVTLDASVDGVREIAPLLDSMRSIIDEAKASLDGLAHQSISAKMTGIPPLRTQIIQTLRRDQIRFLFIGAMLAMVMSWMLFRKVTAVLITTGAPMIGAIWSLGAMGWAGESVNVINAVMPTLVLVIGFTDAVHLMVDIRRSLSEGLSGAHASRHALRCLGPACAMTSLTTVVGFGSLVTANVNTIQRFGAVCAAGTFLTFIVVVLCVPLTSSYLSRNVLVDPGWFRKIEHIRNRSRYIARRLVRHARLVAWSGIVATLALTAITLQLRADNRLAESIPQGIEGAEALDVIDRELGGILQIAILLTPPSNVGFEDPALYRALLDIHEIVENAPESGRPLSILNLLQIPDDSTDPTVLGARGSMLAYVPPSILNRLFHARTNTYVVRFRVPDVGAIRLEQAIDEIETRLESVQAMRPGFAISLTGTTAIAARNVRIMISDLARSLGLATIVILIVLSLTFRSIRLGLISIVPNAFPLVATGALLVMLGKPLQITSVIVFSVCLGIAVDDTIHFITRYQRELRSADGIAPSIAIERAFVKVGAALFITTLVLLAGFGAVTLSSVPAIHLFAQLSCVAIVAALLGDMIILPAMLITFAGLHPDAHRSRATTRARY